MGWGRGIYSALTSQLMELSLRWTDGQCMKSIKGKCQQLCQPFVPPPGLAIYISELSGQFVVRKQESFISLKACKWSLDGSIGSAPDWTGGARLNSVFSSELMIFSKMYPTPIDRRQNMRLFVCFGSYLRLLVVYVACSVGYNLDPG